MRSFGRMLSGWLGVSGTILGVLATSASPAAAAGPHVCTGTVASPGVLAGKYSSHVIVQGACAVNAGAAMVSGNLTGRPGAVLVAAFALNGQSGSGSSSLTVRGNLEIQNGAALILGCDPQSFPCIDDPNPASPTLSSAG